MTVLSSEAVQFQILVEFLQYVQKENISTVFFDHFHHHPVMYKQSIFHLSFCMLCCITSNINEKPFLDLKTKLYYNRFSVDNRSIHQLDSMRRSILETCVMLVDITEIALQ